MDFPLSSRVVPFAIVSTLLTCPLWADVKLPAVISDNMVLQQESKANVWGWADAGEKVAVQFANRNMQTVAGPDGRWNVKLADLKAGIIGDLTIAANNSITVKNVAVGEVWVCSGQSNMEFQVSGGKNAAEEKAAANFPLIRVFTVQKAAKNEPQTDCVGKWEVCTPETVFGFTAVGYFFGRKLHEDMKIPVGLIHTSWGGTPAEYWTPKEIIEAEPDFKSLAESWEQLKAAYPKAKEDYEKALAEWKDAAALAKANGTAAPKRPAEPKGGNAFGGPGCLYNGMIAPIEPYTIQGATWYQGESNASRARQYRKLFPTMIQCWRQHWGVEFPFLFVQLANYNARGVEQTGQPEESQWAELREAQLMTLELPHTGMAVAIDVGEGGDIHPKNKQEVGRRLALSAEASVYYREVAYSGPLLAGSQQEEGKIRLSFSNAEGMKASDGGKLKGFAIAGEDKRFVWADVTIEGDHIVVSSPEIANPVAVRYGWADNPECNLVNAASLPASPFRTDAWPQAAPARK
ncbi:MAG: Sialate O-acetylesterase [Chthoniobacteraceae bacterium]|nr:Sialate O-acetylesterase [Chthoniobacteraceae bacterium]